MLFNSPEFVVFLLLVFTIYWFVLHKHLKLQNAFLLVSSYFFYGWWDWRFLFLLLFTSLTDFIVSKQLDKDYSQTKRKAWLSVSIILNLGVLGYFKYAGFFIESFSQLLGKLGFQANIPSLNIILPVGISFYTFQALSYTIDVYRKETKSADNLFTFLAFTCFFPQLLAGPIERATALLPQFEKPRIFDLTLAKDAMRRILWGLFKKVVIADTCARNVDYIFAHQDSLQSSLLVLGVVYFAFQIYCDFSGYSDMAIGLARLFGFRLMTNFNLPYFSRDVAEFWRRWHISLSSWFKTYVYIPLGGNRCSVSRNIFNVMVVFTVSGLWHGANWTFIIWGALNGLFFVPLMLMKRHKSHLDIVAHNRFLPNIRELTGILITFALICFAWIFFRAENVHQAADYISNMVSSTLLSSPGNPNLSNTPLYLIAVLYVFEWLMRKREHSFELSFMPVWLRWPLYYIVMIAILQLGTQSVSFIYFQF